jgi:predicted ferric reductase
MKFSVVSKSGWLLLSGLVAVPFVIWATILPFEDRFSTTYLTLTSLGRLVGIASMVFFSLNIILTARLKFMETLFGGLNKVYIAHHIIGGLALIVILTHPVVLALRTMTVSPRDAAMQLLPFMNDTMTTIGILTLWTFIVLMILTLYVKLPYKTWLLTHKFMGLVMLGVILHVLLGSNDINADVRLQLYSWSLMSLAALAFLYRTILPRVLVRRYDYTVTETKVLQGGVTRFVLMPKSKGIRFKSGQFIFVSFSAEGFSHEFHPFTISSNSKEDGLVITVKALGEYTSTLTKFAPNMVGMPVRVEGAYGRFSFENFPSKRQIWVAGGIGITPFLSMAADVRAPFQVDLYYSVKSSDEIIDTDYLQQAITVAGGSLRVIPYVADLHGFLSGEKIKEYSGELAGADILLCGPPPMMFALKNQLKSLGVRASRIHSEEFAMS